MTYSYSYFTTDLCSSKELLFGIVLWIATFSRTFAGLISIVIHRPGEGNQGLFVALEQMRRATLTSWLAA